MKVLINFYRTICWTYFLDTWLQKFSSLNIDEFGWIIINWGQMNDFILILFKFTEFSTTWIKPFYLNIYASDWSGENTIRKVRCYSIERTKKFSSKSFTKVLTDFLSQMSQHVLMFLLKICLKSRIRYRQRLSRNTL